MLFLARVCRFGCFVVALLFVCVQALVILHDIWCATVSGFGATFLGSVTGTAGMTASNIVLSSLVYWMPVAWAAFWFVLGMGCWYSVESLQKKSRPS
ncbi:MAG TPA: hypothetical protein VMJ72_01700 [Candidatus Paceibacterota bacterium]|nr:hypothetical protein [Candidatus Paceibacterota bacterium]